MKKIANIFPRMAFIVLGLGSFLWFFIRVIPKPSRASYPCMRASYPIMSSFVVYLISTFGSIYIFRQAKEKLAQAKYVAFLVFVCVGSLSAFLAFQNEKPPVYADTLQLDTPNAPIGIGRGVVPGRVTWAHDPDATNKECLFKKGDEYFLAKNTNIDVVENMVNKSILALTERTTLKEAWEALFKTFNSEKGKGEVSYVEGEKIFIKCNYTNTNGCDENYELGRWANNVVRTSPQVVLIILRHLINEMGIPQENIAFGDPMQCIIKFDYELIANEFPKVKFIDHFGKKGRTPALKGSQADIFYSDRGQILRTAGPDWGDPVDGGYPVYQDTLYKVIEDADYMINIAAMKAHERAGITLCAKNHFGSQVRNRAMHLHMGIILPAGNSSVDRTGYGKYRIQTDLMGHKMLGGNTMLSIVDGLWAGPSSGGKPVKFRMSPFDGDYTSSIFMSMDPVAIESVVFDFLKKEFSSGNEYSTAPQLPGVDDYLRQAADPANWPEGIEYDPENDGTVLTSLGVNEHWNNATDMQYSKNLGKENGIELFKVDLQRNTAVTDNRNLLSSARFELNQNYPNPFNPATTISYSIPEAAAVRLTVFDLHGRLVDTLVDESQQAGSYTVQFVNHNLPTGTYFYTLNAGQVSETRKMLFVQ